MPSKEHDSLSDFVSTTFTHEGTTKPVFWLGEGPAILVMTEMPGITPEVADFARRLVTEGFSVAMPDLFGEAGRPVSNGYITRSMVKGCVAKEFVAFATNKTAPITSWLRALAADAHERAGDARGAGVGAVGMCFTGGFALALAVDPLIMAPILSQPSMPLGITKKQKADVGASPSDIAVVQERIAGDEDFCVIGMRFTGDKLVPPERFARYRQLLGDAFVGIEIDSSPGNPHGIDRNAHSVLTEEYTEDASHPANQAHDRVIELFKEKLLN